MNTYSTSFSVLCPNNDQSIRYHLSIETQEVIQVESITKAVRAIKTGYQEDVADNLHAKFGGRQTIRAHHHGVDIVTTR